MKISSGIFLITPSGKMVIAHPTNHPYCLWSIPKGIVEDGETLFEAAKREFYEETNFIIDENDLLHIESLGEPIKYKNKNKYLSVHVCLLKHEIKQKLICTSMVTHLTEIPFPENDEVILISLDKGFDRLFSLQQEYRERVINIYNTFYENKNKN